MLEVVPLTIDQAMDFLKEHERHYKSDAKPLFAIGISNGELCGAAIMGTRGEDAEICHIYAAGEFQSYSLLYGTLWRATKALGYRKMIL